MTAGNSAAGSMATYGVYGITLRSDFHFQTPLSQVADSAADVTFEYVRAPREHPLADVGQLIFESPLRLASGAPWALLYRGPGQDLLRFSEVVDFYIMDDRIVAYLLDPAYEFLVEHRLLGVVLSFWFERQGTPMIHAAAVVAEGRVAAFMATNKGGKSSLAAALMQKGCPLLSDDLVGIQFGASGAEGRPGFPCMRLWPDQARHFARSPETLGLVHPHFSKRRLPVGAKGFGSFCATPQPLGCFYIPQRREARSDDPSVEIIPLPPRHAIIELVRASYLPRIVEAAGFSSQRMALFARIASAVPVKRLVYPTGVEYLPHVGEAVLADLRASEALPVAV